MTHLSVLIGILSVSIVAIGGARVQAQPPVGLDQGCRRFVARIGDPMPAHVRQITGAMLGGSHERSDEDRPVYRMGPFRYLGAGVEATSSDPRFKGLLVTSDRGAYHRCGYRFTLFRSAWQMVLRPKQPFADVFRFATKPGVEVTNTGSTAAAKANADPVVDGYTPGASWPIFADGGTMAFLGLMHPKDGRRETLLVRFEEPKAGAPTRILARLPILFQSISILPKLHRAGSVATLIGKDPGGPYREVVLEMPDDPGQPAAIPVKSTVICSSLPHIQSLQNLDCSDAMALIQQLKGAQRKLRAGEWVPFHLLSGAPASDPMNKVSPRQAFLEMPFEKANIVKRAKTDNRLWRPYRLSIQPVGGSRFFWDVEVVRGFYGDFERVEMFYGPPPPF